MSSPADFQKHEKSQKICLKTPVKSSCIFNANFNDFCLHFGSQNPSKSGFPSTFFRHFPQDTSKMPPRRPKMPPRHLQDAPKTLQEASKTALRPPKTSPRRLWTAQRRLQVASDCSETLQRVLQDWKIWKNCEFLVIFVRFLTRNSKASSSLPASSTLESHVSPSPPAQEIVRPAPPYPPAQLWNPMCLPPLLHKK